MCSLSIINTYESSILEKYFSKLSVISNAYIVYISSFCLLSVCSTNRLNEKKDLERERKEGLIEHAQGHIRQRQKIRLNTPVIIVVLVHATWLLSSLRVASYASRAETSHTKPSPLYPSPPRKFLAGGEETRAICATRRRRKPREKKKRNGFQAGTKGTRERFRCSEYANGLSWPFRWSARLGW